MISQVRFGKAPHIPHDSIRPLLECVRRFLSQTRHQPKNKNKSSASEGWMDRSTTNSSGTRVLIFCFGNGDVKRQIDYCTSNSHSAEMSSGVVQEECRQGGEDPGRRCEDEDEDVVITDHVFFCGRSHGSGLRRSPWWYRLSSSARMTVNRECTHLKP